MTTLFNSSESSEKVPAAEPILDPSTDAEDSAEPVSTEPEGNLQQTQFAEDIILNALTAQTSLGADSTTHRQAAEAPKPRRKFLPILGGFTVALGVLTVVAIMMPKNSNGPVMPTPTPATQANQTPHLSALERELLLLERDIEAADPLQAKLAFPPVDFTFVLEDATVRQAQQQRGTRR